MQQRIRIICKYGGHIVDNDNADGFPKEIA